MAETFLYSARADNDAMKSKVAEAGGKVAWNKEAGAFALVTEGMTKKDVTALKKQLAEYTSPEAKAAWESDRAAGLAAKEALRAEAKTREPTTKEPKPAKAPAENTHVMYRTPDERADFNALLKETGAKSHYVGRSAQGPHFSVVTTVPEKFGAFMGDEAKARFDAWSKEKGVDTAKNPDVEEARGEAKRRGGAFMAQYQERGFRLSDPSASPDAHQKQLNEMRNATDAQLVTVLNKSRETLQPLRDKELELRAAAAGLPVDQLKQMSFAEQIEVSKVDGKRTGLVGDDFKLNAQLSKGISAIQVELEARGIGRQRDAGKDAEQGKAAEGQAPEKAAARPRSAAKGGQREVTEEASVDNTLATLQAAGRARGQNAGR